MDDRDREAIQSTAGGCAMGLAMVATIALSLLVMLVFILLLLFWTGVVRWV